jgi:hypothetical protein
MIIRVPQGSASSCSFKVDPEPEDETWHGQTVEGKVTAIIWCFYQTLDNQPTVLFIYH